ILALEDACRSVLAPTIEIANEGLTVSAEAADGESAVNLVRAEHPAVVVLDHRMPGVSGLETARRILAEHPDQAIVLFSSYLDRDVVSAAQRMGVRMCLAKDDIRHLPDALWGTEPDDVPRGGGLV